MKKLFYLFLFVLLAVNGQAAIKVIDASEHANYIQLQKKSADHSMANLSKVAKRKGGKKVGFFKKMKMKMLQKFLKKKTKRGSDMPQGAYVVLSIIGLGWLAMGLIDDWQGDNWWICLLLYFLLYFPGLIFALVKMSDYY